MTSIETSQFVFWNWNFSALSSLFPFFLRKHAAWLNGTFFVQNAGQLPKHPKQVLEYAHYIEIPALVLTNIVCHLEPSNLRNKLAVYIALLNVNVFVKFGS